jgi:hypothetical protein
LARNDHADISKPVVGTDTGIHFGLATEKIKPAHSAKFNESRSVLLDVGLRLQTGATFPKVLPAAPRAKNAQ